MVLPTCFGGPVVKLGYESQLRLSMALSPLTAKMVEIVFSLKKVTVHGGVHFMSNWVKTMVSLLMNPITDKDTLDSPRFQLISTSLGKVDIHGTTKHTRW